MKLGGGKAGQRSRAVRARAGPQPLSNCTRSFTVCEGTTSQGLRVPSKGVDGETRPREGRHLPIVAHGGSRCTPSLLSGQEQALGPSVCSPMARVNGWLRAERLLNPNSSSLHYSRPGQALPSPPPPALPCSCSKERLTADVGEIESPSWGTLRPCQPHPGPTTSHLNGCPGLRACHLQSLRSGQTQLVKDRRQIVSCPCSSPAAASPWWKPTLEALLPPQPCSRPAVTCPAPAKLAYFCSSHTCPRLPMFPPLSRRSTLFSDLCRTGPSLPFRSWLKCHLRGACPVSRSRGPPGLSSLNLLNFLDTLTII